MIFYDFGCSLVKGSLTRLFHDFQKFVHVHRSRIDLFFRIQQVRIHVRARHVNEGLKNTNWAAYTSSANEPR